MNCKNKNIRDLYRGIHEFKRGYQARNNVVKGQNSDLLADSHNSLNTHTWKNDFSQLLNVYNVSDVSQIEMHTAEALVHGPSCLEIEIAIAKLGKYEFPGSDPIPVELIQAGGETSLSEVHELIRTIWNK
jgi:hypothetical protein